MGKNFSVITVRELSKKYGERLEITNEGKGSHRTVYIDGRRVCPIKWHGGKTEVTRDALKQIEKALANKR